MARLILPLLGGVLALAGVPSSYAQTSTVTAGPKGVSGSTTVTTGPNGKPCRVVHSDAAKNTGAVSSSVTAGPDGVSSSSTGGPSVTTRSAGGSTSSAASSSSSNGTTMTTADGDCVITVPKDKR
nr:glycosyl hydrolase [Methylobacterium sp. OTU13CASTA1]